MNNMFRRSAFPAVLAIATVVMLSQTAAAGSQTRKPVYWPKSYAMDRFSTKKRFVDPNAVYQGQHALRQAQQVLAYAKAQGDLNEILQAQIDVGEAQGYLYDAKRGWPVIKRKCRGVSAPNRLYWYKQFRCAALLDIDELPRNGWGTADIYSVTLVPLDRTHFRLRAGNWRTSF
jgi:hypothetical protein